MNMDRPQGVSRETFQLLQEYSELVLKWSSSINLISKRDQRHIWDRHIHDSLQVADAGYACDHWVDIGSGGGFPGLVVAIAKRDVWPNTRFTLIESDQRKCVFLRTVIRELKLNATVLSQRIEQAPQQSADILSARALADLPTLLAFADRHLSAGGLALFQKGANWEKEVINARKAWRFTYKPITSKVDPEAVILKIEGVSRD